MKFFLLFILLSLSLLQAKESSLTISTGFNALESKLLKNILKEGFKRAGIPLNFQRLPNQRSLINANSGINDGEAARISKISKIYPNLLRIDVPIHTIHIVLISKRDLHIRELADLKKYQLGVVRGVKITEKIAHKLTHNVIEATDYKGLIKMLVLDRIDAIIVNKLGAYTDLQYFKNTTFYLWKKPIVSPKLYTHLNKKHKKLIPRLEKAYNSMLKDGTLQKIHAVFNKEIRTKLLHSVRVIEYD